MSQYLIIENDRAVDIARSPEDAERRAAYGWRIVLDCSGEEWRAALAKAHDYARQQRKKCHLSQPLSDEDVSRRLHQVYRMLLGDELLDLLGKLYTHDPDGAVEIAQDAIRRRMGNTATTAETEAGPHSSPSRKKPRRKN